VTDRAAQAAPECAPAPLRDGTVCSHSRRRRVEALHLVAPAVARVIIRITGITRPVRLHDYKNRMPVHLGQAEIQDDGSEGSVAADETAPSSPSKARSTHSLPSSARWGAERLEIGSLRTTRRPAVKVFPLCRFAASMCHRGRRRTRLFCPLLVLCQRRCAGSHLLLQHVIIVKPELRILIIAPRSRKFWRSGASSLRWASLLRVAGSPCGALFKRQRRSVLAIDYS